MKKSISNLIFIICIISSFGWILPASAATVEYKDGHIIYELYSNGEASIIKCNESYSGNSYDGVIDIPEELEYKGEAYVITKICDNAFRNCEKLTSITMGNSIASIGHYAFWGCSRLESITLSSRVKNIGNGAFMGCSKLKRIILPSNVHYITVYMFDDCISLECVEALGTIYSIGDNAFSNCTALTKLNLSNEYITSIGRNAFADCDSLTSIEIGRNVNAIGVSAFGDCDNLEEINVDKDNECYSSINGALLDKEQTEIICYPKGNPSETFEIPPTMTSIGESVFAHRDNLKYMIIPGTVKTIGEDAFYNCYGLEKVIIEDGVHTIGASAFFACRVLKYVQAEHVSVIGDSAFEECDWMEHIDLPASNVSIGKRAFAGCTKLEKAKISGGAAASMYSLMSVDSIEGTTVGSYAFENCTAMTDVIFGDSLVSIGDGAFSGCTSLSNVYYTGTEEVWSNVTVGSSNSKITNVICNYNPNVYITYDDNGGVNAPELQVATKGFNTLLSSVVPIRTGHRFIGWTTLAGSTEAQYAAGDAVTFTEDITLYAVWKDDVYVTVTADESDGYRFTVVPNNIPKGSTVIYAWYKDNSLTNISAEIYEGTTEMTYYAAYDYDTIKVFVWNGCSGMFPVTMPNMIP